MRRGVICLLVLALAVGSCLMVMGMALAEGTSQTVTSQPAATQPQTGQDTQTDSYGVVEALIWDVTANQNGIADESPLVYVDGVTANLYKIEDDGTRTFISSKVSGPGAYGMFGVYQAPPAGYAHGWVGWNQLPLRNGDKAYVDYMIEIVAPSGYFITGGPSGNVRIGRVWANQDGHFWCFWRYFYPEASDPANRAFSVARYSSITGHKYNDKNRNGKLDAGEQGLKGVAITLTGKEAASGATFTRKTVTADDGSYSFTNLNYGTYSVSEVVPSGWEATAPITIDGDLPMGQQATGLDFFNAQKQQCCFFNWSNCLCNNHIWWSHFGCNPGNNSGCNTGCKTGCNTGTGWNSGWKTGSCK